MPEVSIAQLLREELDNEQLKRPGYSLRMFSRRVNLSSGTISAIMNGKRKVSPRMAIQIAERLFLEPERRQEFLRAHAERQMPPLEYFSLDAEAYRVIADWQHFAILSLVKTKGFRSSGSFVAERLGISEESANRAAQSLFKLGLLRETSEGNWVRTKKRLKTSDGTKSSALRKAHRINLEMAQRSILENEIDARDISAMTMAIDPRRLPQAVKLIRQFHDQLSQLLETGERREVYKFCSALFPITKINKKEKCHES